jgi:hypothetical protein
MVDETVYVVLSIDTEPDFPPEFSEQVKFIMNKIPNYTYDHFKAVANRLEDLHYKGARWNWMIRADNLIETVHDNSAYMFVAFNEEFHRILASDDEIGFHPHPYAYTQGSWGQERDKNKQLEILQKGYDAVASSGFRLRSVRTGWDMMNSEMMESLNSMGFVSELSALPGMAKEDTLAKYTYDWSKAPSFPYHPSRTDFQQPGELNILEIPQTINRVKRFTGRIFVSAFNPCGRNSLYKTCMIDALKQATEQGFSFLVGFTHLEDFIYSRGRIPKLLGTNGFDNFRKNMQFLTERASQQQVKVLFPTASEVARLHTANRA